MARQVRRTGRLDRGHELPAADQHDGHLQPARRRGRPDRPQWDRSNIKKLKEYSLFGASGGRGGAGGAIFIMVQKNVTHAIVEDGAAIYSGGDGGFNMKAEEALLNVNLAQSAAKGGTFAIGGTVLYAGQTSDTLVQLGAAAFVTGRDARLYAGALGTTATWAGGIATGEALGIGISVAINDIDRTTRALIGGTTAAAGTAVSGTKYIDVSGGVQVLARVQGDVWAFTIAGSVVSPDDGKSSGKTEKGPTKDPTDGKTQPDPLGGASPVSQGTDNTAAGDQTGIALAAAASVNLISDTTTARIADAGQLHAGLVQVTAQNDVRLIAATGGLALASGDEGDTSAALAGAFSFNEVSANTLAEVRDTDLTLSGNAAGAETLTVQALVTGSIFTLAAGGAGARASGGTESSSDDSTAVAVAGSVSINEISGETKAAFLRSTAILGTGNVRVYANDSSGIFSIAGGLSASMARNGSSGDSTAVSAGIAISVNRVGTSAIALIEGRTEADGTKPVTISWNGGSGDLLVEAISARSIGAYTVGGAVSAALGNQGKGVAGSGAGSGSVNEIEGDTIAAIRDSVLVVPGTVTVHAVDSSKISAGAGAIAIAIGKSSDNKAGAGAVGGAFAINDIGTAANPNQVIAEIVSSVVTASGAVTVKADLLAEILSVGIGAAGSVAIASQGSALAFTLAGSVGVNRIHGETSARIAGSTLSGASGQRHSGRWLKDRISRRRRVAGDLLGPGHGRRRRPRLLDDDQRDIERHAGGD
jgi:hypothetical protein